jgi:hypothetical protein
MNTKESQQEAAKKAEPATPLPTAAELQEQIRQLWLALDDVLTINAQQHVRHMLVTMAIAEQQDHSRLRQSLQSARTIAATYAEARRMLKQEDEAGPPGVREFVLDWLNRSEAADQYLPVLHDSTVH